ncbi:MAG: MBL fold metallo-hydrolase [Deltaproteobacteria bacterium]|nr:MBL fold metallo-hydrolase [Deltaproteobacteria bacterium]
MKYCLPTVIWPNELCVCYCFVMVEQEGATLIDSGVLLERFKVEHFLRKINLPLQKIYLTHSHPDHAGNAAYVSKKWKVPVYASADELPYLFGTKKLAPRNYEGANLRTRFIQLGDAFLPTPRIPWAKAYEEDRDFSERYRWIPIPGHTPGNGALLHLKTKSLFLGDSLLNCNTLSWRQPVGLSFPHHFFSQNQALAIRSTTVLKELDFDHAFFGHGPPILKAAQKQIADFLGSRK